MSDSGSSFGKWIGGILATIITGFVLWWLTGPLSPFIHKDVSKEQPKVNDTSTKTQPGNKNNNLVPEQKIIVEASPNPYTIMAGEQTEINVLAYAKNKIPVENASVEIRAGGGFFSTSGNYVELGTTNSNGIFKTYWKAPDPVAARYGMDITVSKDGFITGSTKLTVNTTNH